MRQEKQDKRTVPLGNSLQELLITTSVEGIRKGKGKTATKMMKILSIIYL